MTPEDRAEAFYKTTAAMHNLIQLIKEAIDKKNATADADVDSLLERFIASKWTGAISAAVLLAAVVFVIAAVWSLF